MTGQLVFIAIVIFAGGLVVGYVEGWRRGADTGFHVGWMHANAEIRRIVARTKAEGVTDADLR